jgi:16S rRNA (uracil1498-N3)-methyltransferase
MGIHRVCVPPESLRQSTITLSSSVAHYIRHVLRLRVGDEITAFDGAGQECLVRLTSMAAAHVQGEKLALLAPTMPTPTPLILGQALPKGSKMDLVVEKCSELGLTTLVPLYTERIVVREATSERLSTKMARWQRIAAAAARQCGRRTCLDIQQPMALRDFCGCYGSAPVKLVCWEEERQQGIRQLLERLTGQSPIVIVVGPEGGLTSHEVEMARTEGFTTVSLGSHLLRTETAAIVLTSIVRYSLGDLEPSRDYS